MVKARDPSTFRPTRGRNHLHVWPHCRPMSCRSWKTATQQIYILDFNVHMYIYISSTWTCVGRIGYRLQFRIKTSVKFKNVAFKMATLTSASFRELTQAEVRSAARFNDHLSLFDTRMNVSRQKFREPEIAFAWNSRSRVFISSRWNIYKRVDFTHSLIEFAIRGRQSRGTRLSRSAPKAWLEYFAFSGRTAELEPPACPCITDISVQSISRYKGRRSPLCHSRHGQTLANAM